MSLRRIVVMLALGSLCACGGNPDLDPGSGTNDALVTSSVTPVTVGQKIFFDTRLSEPAGQSCATCHDPKTAFADSRPGPSSQGAIAGRFGPRNAPSIAYASFTPPLGAAGDETGYAGGLFWDGRAASLEAQAQAPLLNPLEMNNPDTATVVSKIAIGPYAADFKAVYGADVFSNPDTAFADAMSAIAAYEQGGIPNRFTSKYDAYLAGKAQLTASEARGLAIFEDPNGANCASCHLDAMQADGGSPLFTDFGYDNIGIPKDLQNPFYSLPTDLNPAGKDYIDNGLGGSLHNPRQFGRFKAPSLRNVAVTAPYGHNGYFADLKSVVDFYNTRDVPDAGWAPPEVAANLNTVDLGNLNLSTQDVADLVAFMGTLTDGYVADGGTGDFSVTLASTQIALSPGTSQSLTVKTAVTSGTATAITLSATSLPAGVSATFNPATVTAGQSATATFTASASAAPITSDYIRVNGTGSGHTHYRVAYVTVSAGSNTGDYSLSLSTNQLTLSPGASQTLTLTTTVVSGSAESLQLSATSLPTGVTASFGRTTLTAGQGTTVTFTASSSAPAISSDYIRINGISVDHTHYKVGYVTVN